MVVLAIFYLFSGTHCEKIVQDVCQDKNCGHGICVADNDGGFQCYCKPGYTGDFCTRDIDECSPDPCKKGKCIDKENNYECVCDPGFTG